MEVLFQTPPIAHCSGIYSPCHCSHLFQSIFVPTVPAFKSRAVLSAGGRTVVGPFTPDPRPKAKPPPPSIYEAAGWGTSAWVADVYCCKGIGCIHGSPGPQYPCCEAEFDEPSLCSAFSTEDESPTFAFRPPRVIKPAENEAETPIPQLDLLRNIPGYNMIFALQTEHMSLLNWLGLFSNYFHPCTVL